MTETRCFVHGEALPIALRWRLVEWCRAHGAVEFSFVAYSTQLQNLMEEVAFYKVLLLHERLGEYSLPVAVREMYLGEQYQEWYLAEVERWALNARTMVVLREYFDADPFREMPEAPYGAIQEINLYRGGRLMLSIVPEDSVAFLLISPFERASLLQKGIDARLELDFL